MQVNIGKGIELAVNVDAIPANVMQHVVYIGLRNILMDSHAGVTREEAGEGFVDQSKATAEKKLAALMAGEVRTTSTREGDPVKAEAIRIATDRIKAALRRAGKKLSDVDAKALRAKAQELVTKDTTITDLARERVESIKALDVDVGGLI